MPSLRALEMLVAIADRGSLTAAAAALHLSQPALSHQLRALEQEVGAAIVDRLPRGVRLTAVGEAMLDAARTGAAAAQRAVALGRAAADGRGGVLRVACAESMTAGLLAPAFALWREEHPDVAIELQERSSADLLLRDLTTGGTDLAVGPRPSSEDADLEVLGEEELLAVCASDHPFARRTAVSLAEVGAEQFVHLASSNGLAAWLDAVAATHAVVLTPSVRVRAATSAAALAAAGLGVALVPSSAWRSDRVGVAVRLDPPVVREVVAMHRAPMQPLVAAFCSVLRRSAPLRVVVDA